MKKGKILIFLLLALGILFIIAGCRSGDNAAISFSPPPIRIPDTELENIVRDKIDKQEGDIFPEDVEDIRSLSARGGGINSVKGLEHFESLTTLDLGRDDSTEWKNEIKDLSYLEDLTNMKTLVLSHNEIEDISPLQKMTELEFLNLEGNNIRKISALEEMDIPVMLLSDNQITDLTPLENMAQPRVIELSGNSIFNIPALEDKPYLERLSLNSNKIKNISYLSDLPRLKHLQLGRNKIEDISSLESLTELEQLIISYNNIRDISALEELNRLEVLSLGNNEIRNISGLSGLNSLESLGLDNNRITDISPLVENEGLDDGDTIFIRENGLDLDSGSEDMENIKILKDRGVNLNYEPQR